MTAKRSGQLQLSLHPGCLAVQLPADSVLLQKGPHLRLLRPLAFEPLERAFRGLARAGPEAFLRALTESGLPPDDAEAVLHRLAPRFAGRPRLPVLWLTEAELATRLGRRREVAVRIGPLRVGDLAVSPTAVLVHLHATGWRIARASEVCLECCLLAEVERAAHVARAAEWSSLPRRASAIALTRSDVETLAFAVSARSRPGGSGWWAGRYGSDRRRVERLHAAGCSRCPPRRSPRKVALPRTERVVGEAATRALRRLGVRFKEVAMPAARGLTYRGLPFLDVGWALAVLRGGAVRAAAAFQPGVGLTLSRRRLAARVETIERTCPLLRPADVPRTPARSLGAPSLPFESWGLYCAEQYADPTFPFRPVTEDTALDWAAARDLISGERLLVPWQLFVPCPGEPAFVSPMGSGRAAHLTFEEATAAGLLELLERDALQRAWYLGRGARPLARRWLESGQSARLVRWLERGSWEVRASSLPTRGKRHTIVAVVSLREDQPPLRRGASLVAAGAAGSLERATLHALREAVMFVENVRRLPPHLQAAVRAPVDLTPFWGAPTFEEILMLYLHPEMRPALDVLLGAGPPLVDAPERPDTLEDLVADLHADDLRPLSVDCSVAAAAPFAAVQTMIVGTQPLAFSVGGLRLGAGVLPPIPPRRALELPPVGYTVTEGALNPYILPLA